MGKRYRIPESHVLPFGYKIRVERSDELGDDWGCWNDGTICLDGGLTPPQARYIFLHEMEHAFKDWLKWVAQNVPLDNPDGVIEEPDEGNDTGRTGADSG